VGSPTPASSLEADRFVRRGERARLLTRQPTFQEIKPVKEQRGENKPRNFFRGPGFFDFGGWGEKEDCLKGTPSMKTSVEGETSGERGGIYRGSRTSQALAGRSQDKIIGRKKEKESRSIDLALSRIFGKLRRGGEEKGFALCGASENSRKKRGGSVRSQYLIAVNFSEKGISERNIGGKD